MNLIPKSSTYRRATQEAETARARFMLSLQHAKFRFTPNRLKADAIQKLHSAADDAQRQAARTAREHPFVIGGIVTAIAGWFLRRPIMALSRKAGVSLREAWNARKHQETSDE